MMAVSFNPTVSGPLCDFYKCFGHYGPVYSTEMHCWHQDRKTLSDAIKYEAKLWKALAPKCSTQSGKQSGAHTYLSSLRCLQAAMVEDNAKRPLRKRLSLHQIIVESKKYKVLCQFNELVQVKFEVKSSGTGLRPICDFGPVARGAQHMVVKVLAAYSFCDEISLISAEHLASLDNIRNAFAITDGELNMANDASVQITAEFY